MENEYILNEEEYQNLRSQLNPQELEEIEKLEKDCVNLSINYWEFYRRAENYRIGIYWTPKKLQRLFASPIYKLKIHLLYKAGELRGIKFGK